MGFDGHRTWNISTLSYQDHLWETSQCIYRGDGSSLPPACGRDLTQHPLLCLQHRWITNTHIYSLLKLSVVFCLLFPPHIGFHLIILFCLVTDDPNAIKDLMQMRLTGGGGGMMAEKLEVKAVGLCMRKSMFYEKVLISLGFFFSLDSDHSGKNQTGSHHEWGGVARENSARQDRQGSHLPVGSCRQWGCHCSGK